MEKNKICWADIVDDDDVEPSIPTTPTISTTPEKKPKNIRTSQRDFQKPKGNRRKFNNQTSKKEYVPKNELPLTNSFNSLNEE